MEQKKVRLTKEPSAYRKWTEAENIPVVQGHHIRDLRREPLYPWDRMGGKGVFVNHDASDRSNDCYICEIPAGGSLKPQRYLFEEMIYVLDGRGATTIWNESGKEQTFEWQEGSLFAIPLNTHHQHHNGQGHRVARFLAVTNAPTVINLFESPRFVFNCPFDFTERFEGEQDYFNGDGRLDGRIWHTNFVSDVRRFELLDYSERGAGGSNIHFRLAKNTMGAHVSEFPVGTYKKAHRHGPGAHVIVLTGQGYSLMWEDGKPIQQFPWGPGSLIIPPDRWFHQHFNTGTEPARYLALRYGSTRERTENGLPLSTIDRKLGGDQIEYEDEASEVRRMYIEACAQTGAEVKMDRYWAGT